MKYASTSWAKTAPITIASKKTERLSFFTWLLESMHCSRRLQAQRFLRTNRHLIADRLDSGLKPNTGDDDNGNR